MIELNIFNKKVRLLIILIIVISITLVSFWYFFAGNVLIGVDNYSGVPNNNAGYVLLDNKKIMEFKEGTSLVETDVWASQTRDVRLFFGNHKIEVFFNNGTKIGTYHFKLDYNLRIKIDIVSNEVYFQKAHFYPPNVVNKQKYIGISDLNFYLLIVAIVILDSIPFVYWWKIRKEEGKNNEPHSKNKGG